MICFTLSDLNLFLNFVCKLFLIFAYASSSNSSDHCWFESIALRQDDSEPSDPVPLLNWLKTFIFSPHTRCTILYTLMVIVCSIFLLIGSLSVFDSTSLGSEWKKRQFLIWEMKQLLVFLQKNYVPIFMKARMQIYIKYIYVNGSKFIELQISEIFLEFHSKPFKWYVTFL